MNNMLKFLVVTCSILLLLSCVKDYKSTTTIKLKNVTSHKISIKAFSKGVEIVDKNRDLNSNSEVSLERNSNWGKAKEPFALGEYFNLLDSLHVIWDDSLSVTYLARAGLQSANKHISFDDTAKNFVHQRSYRNILTRDHRKFSNWDVVFDFTENDYNFARQ